MYLLNPGHALSVMVVTSTITHFHAVVHLVQQVVNLVDVKNVDFGVEQARRIYIGSTTTPSAQIARSEAGRHEHRPPVRAFEPVERQRPVVQRQPKAGSRTQ
jgi:hypothetical protein